MYTRDVTSPHVSLVFQFFSVVSFIVEVAACVGFAVGTRLEDACGAL